MPYSPPAEFAQKYKGRPYDGEIAYTDQQIARLFDAVGRKIARRQDHYAVLSDHGESLGEHGEQTHGVFLYDSTLRIAVHHGGPGHSRGPACEAAGAHDRFSADAARSDGRPRAEDVQGVSLVPAFSGKPSRRTSRYAETLYPKMNMNWSELRAIRTNRWKYIRAPRPELYDLTADPGETNNVIQQHGPEVQKFEAQLKTSVSPGGNGTEKVDTAMLDERVMDQLKSLGYLAGAGGRSYELTGTGMDPKDARRYSAIDR